MTGTFIISLDCEGKWGMADILGPYHHRLLTDDALARVYDDLVSLFERFDVAATFAYVMAFTLTREERRQFRHLLAREEVGEDDWLRHFWTAQEQGQAEGWFQPHALEVVKADGRHEIACHSFCHRPLGDDSISEEGARAELQAAQAVAEIKGVSLRTLVYPRNEIGHVAVLPGLGFLGYRRARPRRKGALGSAQSIAREFNLWPRPEQAEPPSDAGEIVPIPAGYFLNWRFGVRRAVPQAVTARRWRTLLDRAAATGQVVHLWLHPHNLITGPGTDANLEHVLAHAARLRDRGELRVMTQEQYCAETFA